MPTGIYARKNKRSEARRKSHKPDCICCFCKSKRGEMKGTNSPACKNINERNGNWKGDRVGKTAIHDWLKKHYGNANHCVNPNCFKKPKRYDWAKKDHNTEYRRDVKDYQQLCRGCHQQYDKKTLMINGRYGY